MVSQWHPRLPIPFSPRRIHNKARCGITSYRGPSARSLSRAFFFFFVPTENEVLAGPTVKTCTPTPLWGVAQHIISRAKLFDDFISRCLWSARVSIISVARGHFARGTLFPFLFWHPGGEGFTAPAFLPAFLPSATVLFIRPRVDAV